MSQSTWPYNSLTQAPTNLKEAIDWVLRVTGKDGKKNEKKNGNIACLCLLAKAVKDLLYDAQAADQIGPSPKRNWDGLLLEQEESIVKPVLQDLGLVNGGSTSAASTRDTCAGGTEVIKALIDQLAQGLQKWVGWQEGDQDKCCLKGVVDNGQKESKGIGKECKCPASPRAGGQCCTGGKPSHECITQCGISATDAKNKCYLSSYQRHNGNPSDTPNGDYYWPTLSGKPDEVHLLARIFLGSVCLIWSGLSQLGWLTRTENGEWYNDTLNNVEHSLGSFMAAMGYDLDRLNNNKKGSDVWKLLSGMDEKKSIKWQEFKNGASQESVAEYYSSIYGSAKEGLSGKSTESICKDYPLLVLHILASGYFRAGSAGTNKISTPKSTTPSNIGTNNSTTDITKKDYAARKPKTIREILYWLSALPYSKGYRDLVTRMDSKMKDILPKDDQTDQKKNTLELHGEGKRKTQLKKDCITYYLLAACGYCPLVLIGIQGTIDITGDPAKPGPGGVAAASTADQKKCPKHKDNRHKRCTPDEIKQQEEEAAKTEATKPVATKAESVKICYGGYHLEVSKFGPVHGMYANGLFGFDMDLSAAQCLDQLRIYVYHCFYQLYFLRKQCAVKVVDATGKTVLGWNSCRYGKGVSGSSTKDWRCQADSDGDMHTKNCGSRSAVGSKDSPLQGFLCDAAGKLVCNQTMGQGNIENYPEIYEHINTNKDNPPGHLDSRSKYCPVPMGWQQDSKDNHFKDLTQGTHKTDDLKPPPPGKATPYPVHCTGNTLALLLKYYCDPEKQHGTLVVLLRLLACITPTVPRTLGDLFGFYYYVVNIVGFKSWDSESELKKKLEKDLKDVRLSMLGSGGNVVSALEEWSKGCASQNDEQGTLQCLIECTTTDNGQCCQYICPLTGEQYRYLAASMAGTYLSWLVYLIEDFKTGLESLKVDFINVDCRTDGCKNGKVGTAGCDGGECKIGKHGEKSNNKGLCCCTSVVSCTGVLPVLYKYGFGYGNVSKLHPTGGTHKKCHDFLDTLKKVEASTKFKELTTSINQLIYTTRLPWIFVLTLAWLVAVLYVAFGAIWPLDWTHMRSHCRGWFRKGSLSPWEVLMVGKKKGRGILEFFGGK